MKRDLIRNRDAIAYSIWRWGQIHRRPPTVDEALALVDELGELVPRLEAVARKPWRAGKPKPATQPSTDDAP